MDKHATKPADATMPVSAVFAQPVKIPPHINNRFMDDCDASQCSGLTANTARDIALRWMDSIWSIASIDFTMSDSDNSLALVYDRVWFKLTTPARLREAAALVRATAMVWSLLDRCRGYGVDENPEFWRRIFAIAYLPQRTSDTLRFMTPSEALVPGAVALRPQDCGSAFPRIGVLVPKAQSSQLEMQVWHIVCGIDEYFLPDLEPTLNDIVTKLRPHLRDHYRAVVDVVFCPTARSDVVPSSLELNQVVPPQTPLFRVSSIMESERQKSERARRTIVNANRSELLQPGPRTPPDCIDRHVTVDETITAEWTCINSTTYAAIMAMCASLPHTRSSLTTVDYVAKQFGDQERWELPWIRYAIFHPDAMNSSLTKLKLQLNGTTHLSWLTKPSLPTYSELHDDSGFLGSSDRCNTAYHRVQLAAGTVLRAYPGQMEDAILTLSVPTYAELLNHRSSRGGTLRNVVVRSIGICWVTSSDIVGPTEQRRPLKSPCIRELTIEIRGQTKLDESLANQVVRLSGNLTKLDIGSLGFLSNSILTKILKANPKLKSLSVVHDGSMWRDEGSLWRRGSKWPRLEELKLLIQNQPGTRYFAPSQASIRTGSLQHLRSFVAILESESIFDASQRDFAWLINNLPTLSYVVISPPDTSSKYAVKDYAQWKYLSEKRLLTAGVTQSAVLGTDRRTRAMALMSVVCRLYQDQQHVAGGGLNSFGSDVMLCILSFVGVDRRVVWFGPWIK